MDTKPYLKITLISDKSLMFDFEDMEGEFIMTRIDKWKAIDKKRCVLPHIKNILVYKGHVLGGTTPYDHIYKKSITSHILQHGEPCLLEIFTNCLLPHISCYKRRFEVLNNFEDKFFVGFRRFEKRKYHFEQMYNIEWAGFE